MKPADVESNTYVDSSKETTNKTPKFIIGDIVRISKFTNIFAKEQKIKLQIEEFFMTEKILKILCRVVLCY